MSPAGTKLTDRERIERETPESSVQSAIVSLLEATGWLVFHDKAVNIAQGGNPKGFPDIVAAHPNGWMVAIECKTWNSKVSDEQLEWLLNFGGPWGDESPIRDQPKNRVAFVVADDDVRRIVGVARPRNVQLFLDRIVKWSIG